MKIFSIAGNAETTDNNYADIDSADQVLRFKVCDHYESGNAGTRTDLLFIRSYGSIGQNIIEGRVLLDYIRQEFDGYLKCGCPEHGFLRVQCETCHAEHLVAFS